METKAHPLDFEERCKFREQVAGIGSGIQYGTGETVEVSMKSGKTALYKVTAQRTNHVFEDTGQRNWHFAFQEYKG